jgi:hypothetical protein
MNFSELNGLKNICAKGALDCDGSPRRFAHLQGHRRFQGRKGKCVERVAQFHRFLIWEGVTLQSIAAMVGRCHNPFPSI